MTARGHAVLARTRRVRCGATLVGLGLGLVLAGCASQAEQAKATDVCAQVEGLRDAAQAVRDLDPSTVTADEARAALEALQAEAAQAVAAADGTARRDAATLREAVADLRATVVAAGPDALTTARPLVEDQLGAVLVAAETLRQDLAAPCEAG